jgi:hypothetical protein
MNMHPPNVTLERYLSAPLRVGEPEVNGSLAVFPLFGADPRLLYRVFAEARKLGVRIGEVASPASVTDLAIDNPTDEVVLLYDGEEVQGARQNRTFDGTFLVPAHAKLTVPVNCVEQGRWDAEHHTDDFAPAPQASPPTMRYSRHGHIAASLAADRPARSDQAAVWYDVSELSARMDASSDTQAMHDVYETHRDRIQETVGALTLHPGQNGALAAIGGRFAVLDLVSRADAYAPLHGPLCQGYALDALDSPVVPAPAFEEAQALVRVLDDAIVTARDTIGIGQAIRLGERGLTGAGLVHHDELVQLAVFPTPGEQTAGGRTRPLSRGVIRRPSQRQSS